MIREYLECGKAVNTHGVRGTLRFESYCDTPEILARLRTLFTLDKDGSYRAYHVKSSAVHKSFVLCNIEGIDTLEKAISFKGTVFYARRGDLSKDRETVFIQDIIGLDVIDDITHEKYGVLSDVISPAGKEIYVVSDVDGGKFMIPVVKEFVKRIVTEASKGSEDTGIFVSLIEGMRENKCE